MLRHAAVLYSLQHQISNKSAEWSPLWCYRMLSKGSVEALVFGDERLSDGN